MRYLTFLASVLVCASFAFAADFAGGYAGSGVNPGGGGTYETDVIIAKNGDVYDVQWFIGGGLAYEGVGIVKNGLLCVGYASGNSYGVVVYEQKADGSLEGVWTGPGATDLGSETLKRK